MRAATGRWIGRGAVLATILGVLTFTFCGGGPEEVRFAAIGDIGTGGPGQLQIAEVLAERAAAEPVQLVLTLGDNFYPAGVHGVDDILWTTVIEDVYAAPSLDGVPMYATLGNHDQSGFPRAQVEYAAAGTRWRMPAPYYSFSERTADGTEVAFFAVETDPIRAGITPMGTAAPIEDRIVNVQKELDWLGLVLSNEIIRYIAERVHQNDDYTVDRIYWLARRTGRSIDETLIDEAIAGGVEQDFVAQLRWLDDQLTRHSGARWKVVYGHHPLYGHHPTRQHNQAMIDRLGPILTEHGVDLFIGGHDHLMDVMKPIDGTLHVTSGGGSGRDNPYPVEQTDESFHVSTDGGFTLYRAHADYLEIEVVGTDGDTRYVHRIEKE